MNISINQQTPITLNFDAEEFAQKIAKLKDITEGNIDITFVDTNTIVELNQNHLGRDYITDIITFNLGTTDIPEGDIYICPEKAKENATMFKNDFNEEIKLLIVHGILHVLDYKDYTEEEKKIMFAEQDRLLNLVNNNV